MTGMFLSKCCRNNSQQSFGFVTLYVLWEKDKWRSENKVFLIQPGCWRLKVQLEHTIWEYSSLRIIAQLGFLCATRISPQEEDENFSPFWDVTFMAGHDFHFIRARETRRFEKGGKEEVLALLLKEQEEKQTRNTRESLAKWSQTYTQCVAQRTIKGGRKAY